jgi:phospholipid/cholesterol/gamma-HCH transport system ATP-binding protein
MQQQDTLVQVRNLVFARGERVIFDGIDLDIARGSVTAIMGPSGTGKTTLLKLIGGQLCPRLGSIVVDGENVGELGIKGLYKLRQRMGMMFQSGALLTDLSVYENVAFPIMARAIALDPMMVMYDEPFTGQDPISMGIVVKLIRELNSALGLTSIVVSHDVQDTAAIADYVYLLSGGKVVDQGKPDSLWESASEWSQQFLNGEPDGPVAFHYPAPAFRDDLIGGGRRT